MSRLEVERKNDNLCPDHGHCDDDATCCELPTGRYGCCPYEKVGWCRWFLCSFAVQDEIYHIFKHVGCFFKYEDAAFAVNYNLHVTFQLEDDHWWLVCMFKSINSPLYVPSIHCNAHHCHRFSVNHLSNLTLIPALTSISTSLFPSAVSSFVASAGNNFICCLCIAEDCLLDRLFYFPGHHLFSSVIYWFSVYGRCYMWLNFSSTCLYLLIVYYPIASCHTSVVPSAWRKNIGIYLNTVSLAHIVI